MMKAITRGRGYRLLILKSLYGRKEHHVPKANETAPQNQHTVVAAAAGWSVVQIYLGCQLVDGVWIVDPIEIAEAPVVAWRIYPGFKQQPSGVLAWRLPLVPRLDEYHLDYRGLVTPDGRVEHYNKIFLSRDEWLAHICLAHAERAQSLELDR